MVPSFCGCALHADLPLALGGVQYESAEMHVASRLHLSCLEQALPHKLRDQPWDVFLTGTCATQDDGHDKNDYSMDKDNS